MKRVISTIAVLGMFFNMGMSASAVQLTDAVLERVSWGVDAANDMLDDFSHDRSGGQIYPENYAGVYFDDEMNLHVGLTDVEESEVRAYDASYFSDTDVVYDQKVYSLNYLNEIQEVLAEEVPFVTIGIQQSLNRVHIVTNDANTEAMVEEILQSRYPYDAGHSPVYVEYEPNVNFVFPFISEEQEPLSCDNDAMRAGYEAIGGSRIVSEYGTCTLGITGEYDGEPAFLTCAHSAIYPGDEVYRNSRLIGVGADRDLGKTGDWATVFLDSAWEVTPSVYGRNGRIIEIEGVKDAIENMPMAKYGSTAGYAEGKVTETNVKGNIEDIALGSLVPVSRLIKIEGNETMAEPGDSGGPVYWENNFYGTVTGTNPNDYTILLASPIPSGFDPCTTRN